MPTKEVTIKLKPMSPDQLRRFKEWFDAMPVPSLSHLIVLEPSFTIDDMRSSHDEGYRIGYVNAEYDKDNGEPSNPIASESFDIWMHERKDNPGPYDVIQGEPVCLRWNTPDPLILPEMPCLAKWSDGTITTANPNHNGWWQAVVTKGHDGTSKARLIGWLPEPLDAQ